MAYTPVELRHITLEKGLRGYKRRAVDQLVADIADSFEDVWRERADFADRVEVLETELEHHRERNTLLSNTLIVAERAASVAREDAARKADQIVAEAHAEARSIMRTAIGEREQLLTDSRRIRALLRSALEIVEADAAGEQADEERAEWPAREDTREFPTPAAA